MEPIEPSIETSFPTSKRDRKKVKNKSTRRIGFRSLLEGTVDESSSVSTSFSSLADSDGNLEELLDSVNELGEKLKENPTLSSIRAYRRAVRDFLSYVLKNALSVEQHESSPNVLKRKRFTLIKVIDQKLERFAAGIIQHQRTQLEILREVDEISGLLIDLLS